MACEFRWLPAAPATINRRRGSILVPLPSPTRPCFLFSAAEHSFSGSRGRQSGAWQLRQPEFGRSWIHSDVPSGSSARVLVVSYNILGDRNASKHKHLYKNVAPDLMRWERRREVICRELLGLAPDVVCLQEVDHYYDIMKILEEEGYAGNFKRRTGDYIDGCALFWKENSFRLLEGETIQFNKYGLRDNVAQLFLFEMAKDKPRKIVIGNIHVLFSPKRGDIKLGQIGLLLQKAHMLSKKWDNAPIVLAGDFNSTPESGIYKLLSTSKLNLKFYDRRTLSGQETYGTAQHLGLNGPLERPFSLRSRFSRYHWTEEELLIACGNSKHSQLKHPLKLKSSYTSIGGEHSTRDLIGEPLATTYHSKFLGTVDYLWYSDGLSVERVLDTLPRHVLRRLGGLPCEQIGSDHLALACEFAFTHKPQNGGQDGKEYQLASKINSDRRLA